MTTESQPERSVSARAAITIVTTLLLALAVVFIKVPTSLGVKVARPILGEPDLSSSEHIWRVWWRARDDLVDVDPQWLVTASLFALLAVFAAGIVAAIWLVTGPLTDDDLATTDG